MPVRGCTPKLWPSHCSRHKQVRTSAAYWSSVPEQGPGERIWNFISRLSCDIAAEQIIQDYGSAKGNTVIIFPWERGFFYTRNVDVAIESVNHTVKQTITDCIIVILLTIWEIEQPFWLKNRLWFMNSQKTLQLNKSRMWSIMKIFPKSPPLPLSGSVSKSFTVVEGWNETESMELISSHYAASLFDCLQTRQKEECQRNGKETPLQKELHIPKITASFFLRNTFMGARQKCKLHGR